MKNFKKYNNRIDTLEVRNNYKNNLLFNDKNYSQYELIKFEENNIYNKEQEYINDGYEISFGGDYLFKNNKQISRSLFELKETCFVIGYFKPNYNEPDDVQINIYGDRFSDLSPKELINAHTLIKETTIEIIKQIKQIINYESNTRI